MSPGHVAVIAAAKKKKHTSSEDNSVDRVSSTSTPDRHRRLSNGDDDDAEDADADFDNEDRHIAAEAEDDENDDDRDDDVDDKQVAKQILNEKLRQSTVLQQKTKTGQSGEPVNMPPPPPDSPHAEPAPRKRRRKREDPQSCFTNSEVCVLYNNRHIPIYYDLFICAMFEIFRNTIRMMRHQYHVQM